MRRTLFFILLMLLAGPGTSVAQSGKKASSCDPGPISALITMQEELGLSTEQTARLQAIDDGMARRNDPLVTQLMAVRKQIWKLGKRSEFTPEKQEQYDAYLAKVRPLLQQISKNSHAAMKLVGDVLTEDQKSRIGTLLREQHAFRDRHGDGSECIRKNG